MLNRGGQSMPGSKNPKAKLTEDIVREARRLWNQRFKSTGRRRISSRQLAKRYGVDRSTMWSALSGKQWKHVK